MSDERDERDEANIQFPELTDREAEFIYIALRSMRDKFFELAPLNPNQHDVDLDTSYGHDVQFLLEKLGQGEEPMYGLKEEGDE